MVIINNLYPQVIKICRPLIIEDEVLKVFVKKFSESVSKSLSAEHVQKSTVKCNLTYVTDFPDGTETGSFIGLDFSGKVFRLVHVSLKGDHSYNNISRLYEFPDQKLTDNFSKVVDYVAKCVNNFIETYDINERKTILGVASSFSKEQESLHESKILQWGKDFQSRDLKNQDFFNQLKISLKKFKNSKRLYLISLTSNSTACLLSGLYKNPALRIGLCVGNETTISYIEKFKNMTTYTGDGLRPRTALEVEMKNFGNDGILNIIKTEFDFQIDAASDNPGEFVLEKLISGAYLGEIARLCLLKLTSLGIILNGHVTPGLSMKDGLKTSDLAFMEMDEEKKFNRCKAIMSNLGYKQVSDSDCLQIRFVSRCVARRSSNLLAVCLTAMIQRMESKDVHIIADGFLFKEFPNYEYYLVKKINQLKKLEIKYQIQKAEKDEVAIGAGMIAHIYKDEAIKLEDKHRALPPFNINKYNLQDIPASCIDCDCEPIRIWKRETEIPSTPTFCESNVQSAIFDFSEPVYTNPIEIQ